MEDIEVAVTESKGSVARSSDIDEIDIDLGSCSRVGITIFRGIPSLHGT